MTKRLNDMNFTYTVRSAPRNGPTDSDSWNDSAEEISTDLSNLSTEWNTKLAKIIAGLPNGDDDTSIDAFANGLDGNNIWVDGDVTSTSDDTTYYDSTNNRPVTIKEALDTVYNTLNTEIAQVLEDVTEAAGGLTTAQKNRIGANVFDAAASSSSTSLDGKSENNRLNIVQVAKDLYDESFYTLDNNGAANLSYSIRDMMSALLILHGGAWNTNNPLSHTGITVTQADVGISVQDDGYGGAPVDLEDDLNQIRTRIKTLKGTLTWGTALTPLYAGGADSLEGLLASTSGTGIQSATNPWGYDYDDIDGLGAVLDALQGFTGQTTHIDASPTYSSTTYISNGNSLETAVGKLDLNLATLSGMSGPYFTAIQSFTGQDTPTDSTPDYSSTTYISNGDSLETAIGKLDDRLAVSSGTYTLHLGTLQTFVGQDDSTDSTPTYLSTTYVSNGDSLERSIGLLDSGLLMHTVDPFFVSPPSGAHTTDSIHVVASGTFLPAGTLHNVLYWEATPGESLEGEQFRRLEESIAGAGNFTVVHNRGAYPVVQLIQKDPSVLSQEYTYMINHTDNNQFTLMLQSGMTLVDGVIVAIW